MALSIQVWHNFVGDSKKLARRSELAVKSDHILEFNYDPELGYVEGKVQASMRDQSYLVKITLSDSGNSVIDSTCRCIAGLDKCHHKASVLLHGFKNREKTDVKQSWVKRPKSARPKLTQTMDELYPPPPKFANYRATQRPVSEEDRAHVLNELRQLRRYTAMHWILSPEPQITSPVALIEDALMCPEFLVDPKTESRNRWLQEKLTMSQEEIEEVAKLTTGQRDNPLWAAVRKYRVTASNFGKILGHIRRNRYPDSMFKTLTSAYNLSKRDAIIWGNNNEQIALKKYQELMGTADAEQTGIWLDPSGVLGASPDGVVDGRLLEVKCPYSARDMTITQAVNTLGKDFCLEYGPHGHAQLKVDHNYYHQVQGQLFLCHKSQCDFVVWTSIDCVVIRINKDITWQPYLDKLKNFYFKTYIPFITNL